MNKSDTSCGKMPEQTLTKENCNTRQSIFDIELELLTEIRNKYSSNWFNRVYLCYEDVPHNLPNNSLPIKGFNCYKYNSFENADIGWRWDKHITESHKMNIRHTMIPICRWVPQIFDKYILNWELRNMYWLGRHTIRQGYNRRPK